MCLPLAFNVLLNRRDNFSFSISKCVRNKIVRINYVSCHSLWMNDQRATATVRPLHVDLTIRTDRCYELICQVHSTTTSMENSLWFTVKWIFMDINVCRTGSMLARSLLTYAHFVFFESFSSSPFSVSHIAHLVNSGKQNNKIAITTNTRTNEWENDKSSIAAWLFFFVMFFIFFCDERHDKHNERIINKISSTITINICSFYSSKYSKL